MCQRDKYFLLLLLFSSVAYAKIYDCFLFFNEFEILNIRLHELYDHVDKFVLVESEETFRGNPKQLYYQENKHLFEKFADKIIHVVIDGHYETKTQNEYGKAWEREYFQRDQIMRGLTECQDNDIIIISDVDEILRAETLSEIDRLIHLFPSSTAPYNKCVACQQTYYKYFFNRYCPEASIGTTYVTYPKEMPWIGPVAVSYKDLRTSAGPQYFRRIRFYRPVKIENAGWHFSSMGGHESVIEKLAAFSHSELDTPENRDKQLREKEIELLPLVEIDQTFPHIIYENQQEYINKGFIDMPKN